MNQILITGDEPIVSKETQHTFVEKERKEKKVLPINLVTKFYATSIMILGFCMAAGSAFACYQINRTIEENIKPVVRKQPYYVPASDPREKGVFFVQVGAFHDYNRAQEMAESMKRFGTVSIYEAYLSQDGVYRVRLGAYKTRGEALKILDRVIDYGHSDVVIIEG